MNRFNKLRLIGKIKKKYFSQEISLRDLHLFLILRFTLSKLFINAL